MNGFCYGRQPQKNKSEAVSCMASTIHPDNRKTTPLQTTSQTMSNSPAATQQSSSRKKNNPFRRKTRGQENNGAGKIRYKEAVEQPGRQQVRGITVTCIPSTKIPPSTQQDQNNSTQSGPWRNE